MEPSRTEVVVIGAGPSGLSVAAHLRGRGVDYRIFGPPMKTWRDHMPPGMSLKSDGFASNIDDPAGECTLEAFCARNGIPYDPMVPPSLAEFCAYGLDFQQRMVPDLDPRLVRRLSRTDAGFVVELDGGGEVTARQVVIATGITYFDDLPAELAALPREYVTHSSAYGPATELRGKRVAVIGGGASATEITALLQNSGALPEIIIREPELVFFSKSSGGARTLWSRIRRPTSGIGPGLKSKFFADFPGLVRLLPAKIRLHYLKTFLGPASTFPIKERIVGKMPVHTRHRLTSAAVIDGQVVLTYDTPDGQRELRYDHVIAATGYKPRVSRLAFIDPDLREQVRRLDGAPDLSPNFECSVRGLYFVGLSSAPSFGPVMRFAFGSAYAARTVAAAVARRASSPAASPKALAGLKPAAPLVQSAVRSEG